MAGRYSDEPPPHRVGLGGALRAKWFAPFSVEQVTSLERYQDSVVHPYTCPEGHGALQPNMSGLTCWCGYQQEWSHIHD